jgi:hypothetical protein
VHRQSLTVYGVMPQDLANLHEALGRLFAEWGLDVPEWDSQAYLDESPGVAEVTLSWDRIDRPRDFVRTVLERLLPITVVSYVYLWIDAGHPDVRPEEMADYHQGLALLCASLSGTHPLSGCQAEIPQRVSSDESE